MPTKLEDVKKFFERIAVLEAKVEGLMTFQKWQMALLAAILLLAMKNWVR
jgi:hypothetical protein